MANPYQAIGLAVIVPTGGLALVWSAVAIDSALATQAINGTATLIAGTYSPHGFIQHAANKLRTSIYDAIAAQAWFTTEPANAAAVPLKIGVPSIITAGVGATPLRITLATTGGALHAGLSTSWQSFTITNTANAAPWFSLGLAYPGEARSLTVTGGGVDDTGRFQPRFLFFLRSSFDDSGDYPIYPNDRSIPLADGKADFHSTGTIQYHRDVRIKTAPQHIAGPAWPVGIFSAFVNSTTNRYSLTYAAPDETLFTGISGTAVDTTYLATPAYIQAGRYWARYRDVSGGSFRCMEPWPTDLTPVAGSPVQVYPEVLALLDEWRRVKLLFRYATVDVTGVTSWLAKAYVPRASGEWNARAERRGNSLFYDQLLPGVLVTDPELATP